MLVVMPNLCAKPFAFPERFTSVEGSTALLAALHCPTVYGLNERPQHSNTGERFSHSLYDKRLWLYRRVAGWRLDTFLTFLT